MRTINKTARFLFSSVRTHCVSIAEKENVLTSFNQLLYLLIFPKQWVQALQTLPLTTLNLPDQQNKSFRLCERLSTRYKYRDVGKCDLYYKSAVIRITLVEYLRPNVRYLPGKKNHCSLTSLTGSSKVKT